MEIDGDPYQKLAFLMGQDIEAFENKRAEMMKTIEKEGDRKQWIYEGLDCLIIRQTGPGHLCGYVGIPEDHPDFGKEYLEDKYYAHGGVNFTSKCSGNVCHEGEVANKVVWWIGFDCAHSGDLRPMGFCSISWKYRDMDYVTRETETLARQVLRRGNERQ